MSETSETPIGISRTIAGGNPEMINNFNQAFAKAIDNGRNGIALTPDLYGQYSSLVVSGGKDDSNQRFMDERAKTRTKKIIDHFYQNTQLDNGLTIESLGEFYDDITLNEPLFDSNTRTSVVALAHLLTQYGFKPPEFKLGYKESRARLEELQKQTNSLREAKTIFLQENILDTLPHRQ